jgi:ubiquinone/menaquinone biosynthesis C-methylase UbiE
MKTDEIKNHWTDWATTHGEHLNATTKTPTIKALEIDVFVRTICRLVETKEAHFKALEVGCGNGANCMALAQLFPNASIDGVDYVAEMVESAKTASAKWGYGDTLRFFTGNVLDLSATVELHDVYDIVLTDRCLINLNTVALQKEALRSVAKRIKTGGHLIMIENSIQTYNEQNNCRELLGLEARTPASYNLFFDEREILPHLDTCGLQLLDIEDFGSLHDLLLYVLIPSTNGGTVDYAHPLVEAATALSKAKSQTTPGAFGRFGQNRMYVCRQNA